MKNTILLFLTFCCFNNLSQAGDHESNDQFQAQWLEAIKLGNLTVLKELIGTFNINTLNHGQAALHSAARDNNEYLTKFLLSVPDININVQDKQGNTPLMIAICWAHTNIIELLLKDPKIDVNIQSQTGTTALILAAERDYRDAVKLLLAISNIKINIQNQQKQTAIISAQNYGRYDVVKLIQDKIDTLNNKAFEALNNGDLETLKYIISQIGLDKIIDKEGHTLLDKAFSTNNLSMALFLLHQANDPREFIAQYALELVNPTSELFKLFLDLAYNKDTIKKDSAIKKSCALCAQGDCTKKCGRCKQVYYCSVKCQKKHWKIHKHSCKTS